MEYSKELEYDELEYDELIKKYEAEAERKRLKAEAERQILEAEYNKFIAEENKKIAERKKNIAHMQQLKEERNRIDKENHEDDMNYILRGVTGVPLGDVEEFDCVIFVFAHGGCDKSGDVIAVDESMNLSIMRSSCFGNVSYGRNYPERIIEMITEIRKTNPSKIAIFERLQSMFRNRKNRNATTRSSKGAEDEAERLDPGWSFGINGSHYYNTYYEFETGFRDSITVVYSNKPELTSGQVITLEDMSLRGLVGYLRARGFKNPAVIEDACHSINGCPVEDAMGIMKTLTGKHPNLIGGKKTRKYKSKYYHRKYTNRRRGT